MNKDALTGETAGRFTLHRKLPAGGMGRVFEAEDPVGPRRVALKLIDLGTDPDSLEILSAERLGAELQTRLCAIDKRVTAIYESGEMPRYFYIVMEYVDGRDLSELYVGTGLEPTLAARITQDVLEVLDHAHNFSTTLEGRSIRGVVHGDLKPRNIRLTPGGRGEGSRLWHCESDLADAQLYAERFWQCAVLLTTAAPHRRGERRRRSLGRRRHAL